VTITLGRRPLFLGWIPLPTRGGIRLQKGEKQNGKHGCLPSAEDGKEAWAEDRQRSIAQAVHAQTHQQEVR
jgi:hypothetical protein